MLVMDENNPLYAVIAYQYFDADLDANFSLMKV